MGRFFVCASSFICLALLVPTTTNGQNILPTNPIVPVTQGTPEEYAQLRRLPAVVGKLCCLDQGSNRLTLEIQYQYPVAQSPQQMQQIMMQMQQMSHPPMHMGTMCCCGGMMGYMPNQLLAKVTLATGIKRFELDTLDNLIVRRATLPPQHDANGKLKKYTQSEIRRSRGSDLTKPGYMAKYEDLQTGQLVTLYLTKPKADLKADKKGMREENTGRNVSRPQVRMVLIFAEPNVPALTTSLKK